MQNETPEISVVLPVYKNRAILKELHRRLCETLNAMRRPYELVFVDDACPQGSLQTLQEIARRDARVIVVAHEKNAGQYRALLTGLARSRGEVALVMDADLQDPPEAIPALVEKLSAGYGAVYAGRRGHYQSEGRLLTSRIFKGMVARLTGMPADAGLFVALSRRAVRRLLAFDDGEARPYLTAMIACVGLQVISIPVLRAERASGVSSYSGWMRLKIGLRGVWQALRWRYLKAPKYQRLWSELDETA